MVKKYICSLIPYKYDLLYILSCKMVAYCLCGYKLFTWVRYTYTWIGCLVSLRRLTVGISFFFVQRSVYVVISSLSLFLPVPHRAINHDATFGMEPHYFSYFLTIRLWTRGGDSEAPKRNLSALGGSPPKEAPCCDSLKSF